MAPSVTFAFLDVNNNQWRLYLENSGKWVLSSKGKNFTVLKNKGFLSNDLKQNSRILYSTPSGKEIVTIKRIEKVYFNPSLHPPSTRFTFMIEFFDSKNERWNLTFSKNRWIIGFPGIPFTLTHQVLQNLTPGLELRQGSILRFKAGKITRGAKIMSFPNLNVLGMSTLPGEPPEGGIGDKHIKMISKMLFFP